MTIEKNVRPLWPPKLLFIILPCLAAVASHVWPHVLSALEVFLFRDPLIDYTPETHGIMASLYTLPKLVAAGFSGILYSKERSGWVLTLGVLIEWIGQFIFISAMSTEWLNGLFIAQAMIGFGAGATVVTQRALISTIFDKKTMTAMGIAMVISSTGRTLAKALSAPLAQWMGEYRGVFFLTATVTSISFCSAIIFWILTIRLLRKKLKERLRMEAEECNNAQLSEPLLPSIIHEEEEIGEELNTKNSTTNDYHKLKHPDTLEFAGDSGDDNTTLKRLRRGSTSNSMVGIVGIRQRTRPVCDSCSAKNTSHFLNNSSIVPTHNKVYLPPIMGVSVSQQYNHTPLAGLAQLSNLANVHNFSSQSNSNFISNIFNKNNRMTDNETAHTKEHQDHQSLDNNTSINNKPIADAGPKRVSICEKTNDHSPLFSPQEAPNAAANHAAAMQLITSRLHAVDRDEDRAFIIRELIGQPPEQIVDLLDEKDASRLRTRHHANENLTIFHVDPELKQRLSKTPFSVMYNELIQAEKHVQHKCCPQCCCPDEDLHGSHCDAEHEGSSPPTTAFDARTKGVPSTIGGALCSIAPLPLDSEDNPQLKRSATTHHRRYDSLQECESQFSYSRNVRALTRPPPRRLAAKLRHMRRRLKSMFHILTPSYWLLNLSHALGVAWLHAFMAFSADMLVQTYGLSANEAGYMSAMVSGGVVFILPIIGPILDSSGRALQAASAAAVLGSMVCFYLSIVAGVPGSLGKKLKNTPQEILNSLAVSHATKEGYFTAAGIMCILSLVEACIPSVLLGRLAYPDCVRDSDYLGLAFAIAVWIGAPMNALSSAVFGRIVQQQGSYRPGFLMLGFISLLVLVCNICTVFFSDRLTWGLREKSAIIADVLVEEREDLKKMNEMREKNRQIALVVKPREQKNSLLTDTNSKNIDKPSSISNGRDDNVKLL